jgi:hypothetical protein
MVIRAGAEIKAEWIHKGYEEFVRGLIRLKNIF